MRLACADFFSWIEKGATIVTPTPLLAAVASEQFSNYQLAGKIESWQRPRIVSIGPWLTACWQEARYSALNVPVLLSSSQEHALWQRIIEETNPNLFNSSATARLASRAARLINEWLIPIDGEVWDNHQDARQFIQWYKRFRRECADHHWITRSDLWRVLPQWLASGSCSVEPTVFVAFSRLTPALEKLLPALGHFAQVKCGNPPQIAGRILVKPLTLSDSSAELEYAARWARSAVERGPLLSIGIIIPDLPARRSLIERVFARVFYPPAVRFSGFFERSQAAFHINAATPLSETPLVSSAFLLLEIASTRIMLEDAGAILRCPYVKGAAAERSLRALADAKLRSRRSLEVNLRDIEYASADCSILQALWRKVHSVVRQPAIVRDLAGWSKFIGDLLAALGWPGDADLTGDEQEILEAWKDSLSNLSALGLVSGAVTRDAAIAHLSRILGSAPDIGNWSSPVQILSPTDAAGIVFDEALVTGLSEETWPPRVDISPLVPLTLQRACGVPGSGPESLRSEGQRASSSLFELAPVLNGAYSGRLSPFVRNAVIDEAAASIWTGKLPRESYTPVQLEQLEDSRGPAYYSTEFARGGSAIIKSQSQCPFRAFAEYRLNARPLDDAALGFDARERGGFLHKALQLVWQQLGTQKRLRDMPADELHQLVEHAVAEAVHENQFEPFHQIASSAERQRLRDLILLWLDIERSRKFPFTVETVEEERSFEVPGLRLRLRVDRIDRLQNGSLVLIDYKSGSMSRNKLKCPRPPEPQLLVYASAMEETVDGVFFAELQARDPRVIGLSREKHFDSKSVDVKGLEWDSILSDSEAEVVRLANEFVEGYAAVHPISGACEYCAAKAICRVNEVAAQEETAE